MGTSLALRTLNEKSSRSSERPIMKVGSAFRRNAGQEQGPGIAGIAALPLAAQVRPEHSVAPRARTSQPGVTHVARKGARIDVPLDSRGQAPQPGDRLGQMPVAVFCHDLMPFL